MNGFGKNMWRGWRVGRVVGLRYVVVIFRVVGERGMGMGADFEVKLSKTHGQPGPPPPGIAEEVMKQLDGVFRPGITQ